MFETAYGMSSGGGQTPGKGLEFTILWLVLIFGIFYFLIIRPQQKRQKEQQKMISQLQKGDRVVTNSGMFGTIVGINEKENIIVLKIGEDVKVEFLRSSIAGKVAKGS